MNLVNKKVVHKTFGKGNIINYDDSYIKINFESGDKRFVFPDIFRKHIAFIDQKASNLIKKKLKKKREERKKKEEILKKEKDLERERQYILKQKKQMKSNKTHSKLQSVFWCKEKEDDKVFTEWRVFTGKIKSGKNEGRPRRLARLNQNSACLLTKRDENMKEKDRQILGLFMAKESFDGRLCEDGYIEAHPEYRIHLSEEESEKMLFWNYYFDRKSSKKTTWNSGRQRYFDNIWMAQILRDIVSLKEDSKEKEDAQSFFEYFCKVNLINKEHLPSPNGALIRINAKNK